MYAKVLISYEVKSLDKTFTYIVPKHLNLKIGMKVKVPFNNRKINGFVLEITNSIDNNYDLKEIAEIVDDNTILIKEQLLLGEFLKKKTLCPLITAYETMLPKGIKVRSLKTDYSKYENYLSLNVSLEEANKYISNNSRYLNQTILLEALCVSEEVLKKDYNQSSVNTLIKKRIIKVIKKQSYRINKGNDYEIKELRMTSSQKSAFTKIKDFLNNDETFLLKGVTGSGKTLVYINLIKEVLKLDKTALILVPEISLTTQLIEKFYNYFGSDVAIFHSGLSAGERYDEYLKILKKEVKVVVGTRSAVFAPLINLGIIIIDEEHSDSYKQDNTPRYHARDMALWRSKFNKCPLLLGSATPSLESMARALKGIYKLVKMDERVNKHPLPTVKIIDMHEEMKQRNFIFSQELITNIKDKVSKKEQIILLLNRRGFSTFITCRNCGYTYKCPHCDISLTYHKTSNNLRCHYCGYTITKSDTCPECGSEGLDYFGLGTEKLENELKKQIPEIRIVRMDADTTTRKGSHERIIKEFGDYKYDVLLGTQMISKGLDFSLVTLVGVINADASLNIPDYKSNETTFSLLNQVAGRSGRSDKKGEVIIQTFNPENYTLICVKDNDYQKFYNYEMNIRKTLKYPPYVYLIGIKVISSNYDIASKESIKARDYLKKNLSNNEIVLGPTTASVFKFQNKYRFQIIVKYKNEDALLKVLTHLNEMYVLRKDLYLEIDINPSRI